MLCSTCGSNNPPTAINCEACGSPLTVATDIELNTGAAATYTPSLPEGTLLLNGTFRIGPVLGQGGFGITYKSTDVNLQRSVAIKEFFPAGCVRYNQTVQPTTELSSADYQATRDKFIEEARTLARFSHPSIVRVFDTFEENNTAYMVMEFLEGKTLEKLVVENGVLPEDYAIAIIETVGEALEVVHAVNLIHRDIKPDNIMVTSDGRSVLIDFGTARAFAAGKTVNQTTLVTPGYAPLEQYSGQARFGVYSDVYALGATLYRSLTGEMPPQAIDRSMGVQLTAPHIINPSVSHEVSEAVAWAMQLKAPDRPQTVREFLNALRARPTSSPIPQAEQTYPQWEYPQQSFPEQEYPQQQYPQQPYPQQQYPQQEYPQYQYPPQNYPPENYPQQYQPPYQPPIPSPTDYSTPRHYRVEIPLKHMGTEILVCGIVGLYCCPITAPYAWYKGEQALKEYGNQDPGDRSLVNIGRFLGIIGTIILVIRIFIAVAGVA